MYDDWRREELRTMAGLAVDAVDIFANLSDQR